MKWLKYQYHTVANDAGRDVDILTPMSVPDTEDGRAVAGREAYNGEIETYDDSLEETADG